MTSKTATKLTTSEWQAVCLRDIEELYTALKGIAYPTDEALAQIDRHMARWSTFMRSWKLTGEQQSGPAAPESEKAVETAEPAKPAVKKKGGWPKGRSRKPRAEQQATVQ